MSTIPPLNLKEPPRIPVPDKPEQLPASEIRPQLIRTSRLIGVEQAREKFKVTGKGLTVAVLDTGLRVDHVDFGRGKRVPAQRNFTADNGGDAGNAADGHGHGSNVGGIIVANGGVNGHIGMAPKPFPPDPIVSLPSPSGCMRISIFKHGLEDWLSERPAGPPCLRRTFSRPERH